MLYQLSYAHQSRGHYRELITPFNAATVVVAFTGESHIIMPARGLCICNCHYEIMPFTPPTTDQRYLIYHEKSPVFSGFNHSASQLCTQIREAAWLGRVPVFPNVAPFYPHHNFGHPNKFPWSKYLDISNINSFFVLKNYHRAHSLSAITQAGFDALNIPDSEQLKLALRQISPQSKTSIFA